MSPTGAWFGKGNLQAETKVQEHLLALLKTTSTGTCIRSHGISDSTEPQTSVTFLYLARPLNHSPAMSRFENFVDQAPDAAFALIEQFKADSSPVKVDLSPGFYRDEDAKPCVLPSVQMVVISPNCLMVAPTSF